MDNDTGYLEHRLVEALSANLDSQDVEFLASELNSVLKNQSIDRARPILSALNQANVRIVGNANIIGNNNKLIYINNNSLREIVEVLWKIRDSMAKNTVLGSQELLEDKLLAYVLRLINEPEYSEWNQQRYFELELGGIQNVDKIKFRLTISANDMGRSTREKVTVSDALQQFRRIVMIGEPGSGKTTALRRLANHFASEYSEAIKSDSRQITTPLPVYIWLPRINSIGSRIPYDKILDLIRDAVQRLGLDLDTPELGDIVNKYVLVLLLDGLNEIGDETADIFLDGINIFLENHPNHMLVLTSRSYNFRFGKQSFPVLELIGLSYPREIEQYLKCYLHPSEVSNLMAILDDNFQLRQLAVNPLLLFMMIMVYKFEGKLPQNRGRLFQKLTNGLLGNWRLSKVKTSLGSFWVEDKQKLLETLGYVMKSEGLELTRNRIIEIFQNVVRNDLKHFSQNNPDRPINYRIVNTNSDFNLILDELKEQRILLETRDPETLRFWHQTIQEYFAASQILDELWPLLSREQDKVHFSRSLIKQQEKRFVDYINDNRWHEILAVASGLLDDKIDVMGGASSNQGVINRFLDLIWKKNKLLAALCISDHALSLDLDAYIEKLKKSTFFWGIHIPRLLPYALMLSILIAIWVIPNQVFSFNFFSSNYYVSLMFWTLISICSSVLFFRLYASTMQKLEIYINYNYIRPNISALRYIKNEAAEGVLAEFNHRIKYDFSFGEAIKNALQSNNFLLSRTEKELIIMLNQSTTRLQSIDRLTEIGSELAITPLISLLKTPNVDILTFRATLQSLIRIAHLYSGQRSSRDILIDELIKIVENENLGFQKRRRAFLGLIELGEANAKPPRRKYVDIIKLKNYWIILAILIIALLVMAAIYIYKGFF